MEQITTEDLHNKRLEYRNQLSGHFKDVLSLEITPIQDELIDNHPLLSMKLLCLNGRNNISPEMQAQAKRFQAEMSAHMLMLSESVENEDLINQLFFIEISYAPTSADFSDEEKSTLLCYSSEDQLISELIEYVPGFEDGQ